MTRKLIAISMLIALAGAATPALAGPNLLGTSVRPHVSVRSSRASTSPPSIVMLLARF